MMSALKMTAERTALCGEASFMTFNAHSGPIPPAAAYSETNIAGRMAKNFATSLAMLNVVSAPARHELLLSHFHDVDELGRVGVQVDHVPRLSSHLGS